jgi:predicted HTH transcriptional regulator
VEFKSSILWDYHRQQTNKHLSEPIIKNVTAFMNSEGGYILIGVADDGQVLGLDADFAVMKKPNPDGFELMFNNAFNRMVGAPLRRFVELRFPEVEGKTICVVRVRPASRPVYFRHQGKEQFYIRAGNAAQPLLVSEAASYIRERF